MAELFRVEFEVHHLGSDKVLKAFDTYPEAEQFIANHFEATADLLKDKTLQIRKVFTNRSKT